MGSFLGSKNGLGTKHAPRGAPRGATTKIPSPILDSFWSSFLSIFEILGLKRVGLTYIPFFRRFLGRPERSKGWANMQSVHAGAVQTHFSIFALSLKSSPQNTSFWVPFWTHFSSKMAGLGEKRVPKKCFKKRCPARLKQNSIHRPGGSLTAPLACAVF